MLVAKKTSACPIPNPQTCGQVPVKFKTQLVPPALAEESVKTEVFFTKQPFIEAVCPEKVIICGVIGTKIMYTAVDEKGEQYHKVIRDERAFECIIDRDDANEGDSFEVCGFSILCEGTPILQNSGTRPKPCGKGYVDVFWKVVEKDIVRVCIRKKRCKDCKPS
ncbi:hypothetical protein [Bacillus rhizoplanae]|uniref:hypothetical protein n=1 Tax=Bacillus rhizoplanae TaxID=2880966 RepID=UPI003D2255C0